jgi:hypothetical protein
MYNIKQMPQTCPVSVCWFLKSLLMSFFDAYQRLTPNPRDAELFALVRVLPCVLLPRNLGVNVNSSEANRLNRSLVSSEVNLS